MPKFQYDVFLSHNSEDKPAVEWLAAKLVDEGKLTVFLDKWHLVPGDPWQEELENALDESSTVAVFLGPAGISGWHNAEMRKALGTRVDDPGRRVIPVLLPGIDAATLEEVETKSFLKRFTWVDFRKGLDDADALRCLIAGIKGEEPGRYEDGVAALSYQPYRTPQTKRFPDWGWFVSVLLALVVGLGISSQWGKIWLRPSPTITPAREITPTSVPATLTTVPLVLTAEPTETLSPTITPTQPPDTPQPGASLGSAWSRAIDGAVMVYVPAGEFEMGSTKGDFDELPVHTVTLDGFWIDMFEVTNAQFAAFLNEVGNQTEGNHTWLALYSDDSLIQEIDGKFQPKSGYANHPVVEVSWYGARAYAEWVGGRLPTEAEWEYAARGPESSVYPWGAWEPTCQLVQFADCSEDTIPVGRWLNGASWVGAMDMAGNVAEWVADWYAKDFYRSSPRENPTGPTSTEFRVLRGGSFESIARNLRCAFRDKNYAYYRSNSVGFRVVLESGGE